MFNARKFLSNYTALVTGDLISRVLAFAATAYIARLVGKEGFGFLGFAVALTAYFEFFARQGFDTYGIQAVARTPSQARQMAETLIGLRLTTSVLAFSALTLVAWCLPTARELKLLIILQGLMFFTAACSPQWVFQAIEAMKFAAGARIISTSIFVLGVGWLLRKPGQLVLVPMLQFAGEAVAVIWLLHVFSRRWGNPWPSWDAEVWGQVLRESAPMGWEGAFGIVLFNFDILMLGIWRSTSEVGEYSAAYKFINFASAFIFLYGNNLLPVIARNRGNIPALRQSTGPLFKYTLLLALPLAAGGGMLARDLLTLLFGAPFAAAAGALQILIWVIPLVTCRVVFRNILLSHDLQRDLLRCTGIAAVLNMGMNLVLIPRFSYTGAAIAMVCSEVLLLLFLAHRTSIQVAKFSIMEHIWKPVIALIPMMVFLVLTRDAFLAVRIGGGAMSYALAARGLGAFSLGEIRNLLRPEEKTA
jgi:O-antigen/teichoic acid export membrane protein